MTELRVRLNEAIAEVERELAIRRNFYPERVRARRMNQIAANAQMARLEAARDFLIELRAMKFGYANEYGGGQDAGDDGALEQ